MNGLVQRAIGLEEGFLCQPRVTGICGMHMLAIVASEAMACGCPFHGRAIRGIQQGASERRNRPHGEGHGKAVTKRRRYPHRLDGICCAQPEEEEEQVVVNKRDTTVRLTMRSALLQWPYAGIGSFAHLKHTKCLTTPSELFDIAIIGAPFDTAVSYRPGE